MNTKKNTHIAKSYIATSTVVLHDTLILKTYIVIRQTLHQLLIFIRFLI